MNFIAKHLISGVVFVVGIILLIVGLFSEDGSGLVWTGALAAIGGISYAAYNMYQGFVNGSALDAASQLAFGSKESQKRRSSRRLGVGEDLDLGDD